MKRTIATKFMLVVFALVLAACSPGSAATGVKEAATQAGAAIPFPEMAGLDQLNSYSLSLRVSFTGTRDGQALDTTDIYTRAVSLEPLAQFTTIQTTDDAGTSTTYLRGWIGDVLYMRAGSGEPCTARIVASDDRETFNPAALIVPIVQGEETGLETVNGVPARHYAMNTVQRGYTQMGGEVWIAAPGGYVVKYSMSIKGGEESFGKGVIGEKTISFEVSDAGANKPVSIPTGCPPPVTDLPAMADAADATRSLSELSYTTAASLDETASFYKDQMKALGWDLESSSIPSGLTQPQAGIGQMPDLSKLAQVPGLNLGKYLPTPKPAIGGSAAPVVQDGWLIFVQAKEQRSVYISLRPEGAKLRVQIQIVQD